MGKTGQADANSPPASERPIAEGGSTLPAHRTASIYYGWHVVIYAGFIYALILGSTFSAFGLFVIPVSKDFQLSRAEINTALILLNVGAAFLAPLIGWLLDRVPARRIMIVSALLAGLSFSTLAFSQSLWLSAMIMGIPLAVVVHGGGTLTMSVLLARWFTIRRGRAMLLAYTGASLGGVLVAPAIGWLLGREGWRTTLLIMGITAMLLLLAMALTIRERPRPGELERAPGCAMSPEHEEGVVPSAPKSVPFLLSMPQFWTIGLGCSLGMSIVQAVMITIVPMSIDAGLTTLQAAGLISIAGVAAIGTKLLLAIVVDRFDRVHLLAGLIALVVAANALLLLGTGYSVLISSSVLLGVSSSALSPLLHAILADRFGIQSFGTVRGLMAPLIALLGAIAIRLAGEMFDHFHDYRYFFSVSIAVGIVAVTLMLSTRFTRKISAEAV